MTNGTLPITREGHEKLVAELHLYKTVERPTIIQAIQEARAQGDLSENAEYDAAKEKQGKIEDRIRELEDKIARAHIIDIDVSKSETVIFGAIVTVIDLATQKELEYQLVGPEDVDILRNRISILSPIGKALVGKRPKDAVEVTTPRGLKNLVIKSFPLMPLLVLIHGDNPPEREAVLQGELDKAMGAGEQVMGAHVFQGAETDAQSLLTALTPSLFSETGAVVIQGIEECSAAINEILVSGVRGALESGISVFLVGEKGPNQTSKAGKALMKLVKEVGKDLPCPAPKLHELPGWVEKRVKARFKRTADRDAVELLVERAGTTDFRKVGEVLADLDQELEKIDSRLDPGQKITVAMVEEMVGDRRPVSLQEFLDALAHRKPAQLVKSLLRLREEGDAGLLLAQTAWTEFVQLFRLRKALDRGERAENAARDLGINAFVFQKRAFETAAKSRPADRWLADMASLCKIESQDKRGHYQNEWLLELEFHQISR